MALNPLQQKLSGEMVRYWTTASEASQWREWPRYVPEEENVFRLMLPQPQVLQPGRFAKDHRCQFWDQTGIY